MGKEQGVAPSHHARSAAATPRPRDIAARVSLATRPAVPILRQAATAPDRIAAGRLTPSEFTRRGCLPWLATTGRWRTDSGFRQIVREYGGVPPHRSLR